MGGNGLRRSGEVFLILSIRLVLLTRSHRVIISLSMVKGIRHRVPNLILVGLSSLLYILLVDFVVSRTVANVRSG